jgi:16S rRNA (adenine1518-N6/adenine1519-N6)-dimethyltransferase
VRRRRDSAHPPPLKRFGQHFLADRTVLERIVEALALTGGETVVEIGPGRGALTGLLRPRARELILIEIDRALAAGLRERWGGDPGVKVVEGDVLDTDLPRIAGGPYVLVGNVPYYITTPIVFRSLAPPQPVRSVFLVQREVAERMSAAPNSDGYGALSVNVQALTRPELLFTVPAGAFRPPPKVESAVVRLVPRAEPLVAPEETEPFQRFVQRVFGMRRKQLQRVLRSTHPHLRDVSEMLRAHGWDPGTRPETLSPEEFVRLYRAVTDASARTG